MSINKYRLKHLAKNGNKGALLASKLLSETDKVLSVILLCNNFSNAAAATLVAVAANSVRRGRAIALLSAVSLAELHGAAAAALALAAAT
jgi:Mg2+/Co2+ transporter CorB